MKSLNPGLGIAFAFSIACKGLDHHQIYAARGELANMNQVEFANDRWQFIRRQIIQMVLEDTPEHKRERLDVVDAMQAEFPQYGWLEIALWMDGTNRPTARQQLTFWNWARSRSARMGRKLADRHLEPRSATVVDRIFDDSPISQRK